MAAGAVIVPMIVTADPVRVVVLLAVVASAGLVRMIVSVLALAGLVRVPLAVGLHRYPPFPRSLTAR